MQRPSSPSIRTLEADEIDHVAGGQLAMLALQNVVSQRSLAITMIGNLLRSSQSTTSVIIGNIR
mgnify:CR=1 FL=1